jgi:ADP-ribose pyrophosphatase
MIFEEKTIVSKEIYRGRILCLREETVALPGGKEGKREIVSHPGAVAVVAASESGIILVRQYRKPVEEALWELPAGKLEPSEEPQQAARRELAEETGYEPGRLDYLACLYLSPGFSNERIYLYQAEDLQPGEAHPDGDEFLEVASFSRKKLETMIKEGQIRDAKTVAGLLLSSAKGGEL